MPKLRAAMHLDTVFTFVDRDIVTLYPTIMDAVHTFTLRPSDTAPGVEVRDEGSATFVDVVAGELGLPSIQVIDTGGDVYQSERQQWDSGNNAVAARAGRGLHLRPQHAHQHAAPQGRRRGDHDRGRRARPWPRWRSLHDLPDHPRTGGVLSVTPTGRPSRRLVRLVLLARWPLVATRRCVVRLVGRVDWGEVCATR